MTVPMRTADFHSISSKSLCLTLCAVIALSRNVTQASNSPAVPTTQHATGDTSGHGAPITPAAALETSIFGESALMDKETGRIFWEGGSSSTLSESLETRFRGLLHARATLFSVLLWLVVYGWFASWLRHRMQESQFMQNLKSNAIADIPIALCKWVLLGFVPRVPVWLSAMVVVMYLTEAYFSGTHQFLAHRSDSHDVEAFIEQLRKQVPQICWKVRAFHHEPLLIFQAWQKWIKTSQSDKRETNAVDYNTRDVDAMSQIHPFRRKCVSHEATGSFVCPEGCAWHDQTTAGIWTRAKGETRRQGPAPLTKIHLTKVLVLGNGKARQEYFEQQARFVAEHGRDQAAEFATSIEVPGYKPRVLVTRDRQASVLFSRRAFWASTLLGMTLFYRIWMACHCDVIRVSLVKETVLGVTPERKKVAWWSSQKSTSVKRESHAVTTAKFRNLMTQLELYKPRNVTVMADRDDEANVSVHPPESKTSLNETISVKVAENSTSTEEQAAVSENATASVEGQATASDDSTILPDPPSSNATTSEELAELSIAGNATQAEKKIANTEDPLGSTNSTSPRRKDEFRDNDEV